MNKKSAVLGRGLFLYRLATITRWLRLWKPLEIYLHIHTFKNVLST